MNKFRFHVLGVPHTKTTTEYNACAYTQKVFKFCKMMGSRGHEIIHYGVEGSEPPFSEQVDVVPDSTFREVYGWYPFRQRVFKNDTGDKCYTTFYRNAIDEINRRKRPMDFILPFWGFGVKPVCDAIPDLITVEPGIGYAGGFANYRIYESYAVMHADYGVHSVQYCEPQWYWRVIPNYFDLADFDFNPDFESRLKDPYFLFLGRVCEAKGIHIAMDICRKLSVRLVVAGQLSDEYADFEWPDFVEYVGYADIAKRTELMRNAVALIMASTYVEPFGGVQVETMLSGTPTITTDWGAFPMNSLNGVTGYRCSTFDGFLRAALDCLDGKIRPENCRSMGERFSLENVAPMYEEVFGDIRHLFDGSGGWYHVSPDTERRIADLQT